MQTVRGSPGASCKPVRTAGRAAVPGVRPHENKTVLVHGEGPAILEPQEQWVNEKAFVVLNAPKGDMSMKVVRTEVEIARVENWAVEGVDEGTRYPGMGYEQGIVDTLAWLRGDSDTAPDEV